MNIQQQKQHVCFKINMPEMKRLYLPFFPLPHPIIIIYFLVFKKFYPMQRIVALLDL